MDVRRTGGPEVDFHPVEPCLDPVFCEILFLKFIGFPFRLLDAVVAAVRKLHCMDQFVQQDGQVAPVRVFPGPDEVDAVPDMVIGSFERVIDRGAARLVGDLSAIVAEGQFRWRGTHRRHAVGRGKLDPVQKP